MRPLHIGLLMVGAALAASLAVKMTQPPPIPAVQAPQTSDPPIVAAPVAKPAPIPETPQPPPAPKTAAAPAAVYDEPPKPAIRKSKPILMAQSKPIQWVKPTQWTPVPYQGPAKPSVPAVSSAVSAAPVKQNAAPEPLPPTPRHVTLRTGTTIPVRVDESLSSDRSVVGDTFQASLAEPLVVDGLVIAERGARVTGRVIDSQKAGRVRGTSSLDLGLATLTTSDGQQVPISTDRWRKLGDPSYSEDAGKIGGGAALGALIGALAGGERGAAIGAGIGGTAGAGAAMAARGKPAKVPSETIIRFRLASRVTITEQQIAGR